MRAYVGRTAAAGAALLAVALGLGTHRLLADAPAAPPASGPPPALTVTTGVASIREVAASVTSTGTVVPWREVVVGAEVGGLVLTELLVDEGDRVEAGRPVARLSDAVLSAQAEGQRASITEAEATLSMARLQARNARDLVPSRAMSREEAEQRETAARTAEARVSVARASLAETEARLAQTRILAPRSGTVSRRSMAAGSVVAAGGEILRIVQDDRLEVEALVPEADLEGISAGQAATVVSPSGRKVAARVRAIAPAVDQRTRLGTVRVALPADAGLRPGMFVRVETGKGTERGIAVPQESLVWREGRPAVFRLSDGNAVELVPAAVSGRRDGYVMVGPGLRDGDRVVLKGAGFLNDGDRVAVEVADAGEGR